MRQVANVGTPPAAIHPSPQGIHTPREFGPFVAECNKRGIGRTTAYALLADGHLETFLIGTKRYVYVDSVLALPARLAQQAAA